MAGTVGTLAASLAATASGKCARGVVASDLLAAVAGYPGQGPLLGPVTS